MTEVTKGSCMCGAVRFRLAHPLRPVIACHCVECRKSSGHFWAATAVPTSALSFEAEDALAWYQSSQTARRGFCKACGSSLFYDPIHEERIAVSAGALDGVTALSLQSHVFVAEQGDYYEIACEAPQHAHFSGAEKDV